MEKKISDLTITEFKSIVLKIVRKELEDYDPDDELVVKEEVAELLRESVKNRRLGKQKTYSLEEVFGNK